MLEFIYHISRCMAWTSLFWLIFSGSYMKWLWARIDTDEDARVAVAGAIKVFWWWGKVLIVAVNVWLASWLTM
jgi:hypothetical protein